MIVDDQDTRPRLQTVVRYDPFECLPRDAATDPAKEHSGSECRYRPLAASLSQCNFSCAVRNSSFFLGSNEKWSVELTWHKTFSKQVVSRIVW